MVYSSLQDSDYTNAVRICGPPADIHPAVVDAIGPVLLYLLWMGDIGCDGACDLPLFGTGLYFRRD